MPSYSFINTETEEEFEDIMSMADLDLFLAANPHITQTILRAPGLVDAMRIGVMKPDESFRDILRTVKKKYRGSNVNTF